MKNKFLYLSTILIWGTTWIAITFQLGEIDPLVSTFYRFFLASLILHLFCRIRGLKMRFSLKEHLFLLLFGFLLFSVNYWLVYIAELYLTSGLVAVVFSSIVFLNIFNGALFLKTPVKIEMVLGAVIGITGICLIFMPEITAFHLSNKSVFGLVISFISVLMASLGNIVSARNSQSNLPIIQANAYGMSYGALILFILALFLGKNFSISLTPTYLLSLFYLSIFGSILAFGCYLTLIREIGADKASYAIMIVPVVALLLSTIAEGYSFSPQSFAGLVLVVSGNFLALKKKAELG